MRVILAFLGVFLSSLVAADEARFLGMADIVGTWRLENPESESDKAFRLRYHFISRNTALVEVYGDPSQQTTETIFHLNHDELMATHYCGRGNQPRLKAQTGEGDAILSFRFVDITNLTNDDEPHMVAMKYKFISKDRIEKEETYRVKGVDYASTMTLVRDL
jgi:hypothetical protein